MNTILHRAETRGHADHGWLNTYHTFSFASYFNPDRMHFGMLRVLNDDTVAPGTGFGKHPHDNMEIISIPLSGKLRHRDSMGIEGILEPDDIQVMSAGTGIIHSEMNGSLTDPVQFLQLWIYPNNKGYTPRYDQKKYSRALAQNNWQLLVEPEPGISSAIWIHQTAWVFRTFLTANTEISYTQFYPENGMYVFVIEGQIQIENELLNRRDGMGITNTISINVKALEPSTVLLLELAME